MTLSLQLLIAFGCASKVFSQASNRLFYCLPPGGCQQCDVSRGSCPNGEPLYDELYICQEHCQTSNGRTQFQCKTAGRCEPCSSATGCSEGSPVYSTIRSCSVQCQAPTPACGPNEEYHNCRRCDKNCEDPSLTCPSSSCRPGCYCIRNYVRKTSLARSLCIPPESCPARKVTKYQCDGAGTCDPCDRNAGQCTKPGPVWGTMSVCNQWCSPSPAKATPGPATPNIVVTPAVQPRIKYQCINAGICTPCDENRHECFQGGRQWSTRQSCLQECFTQVPTTTRRPVTRRPVPVQPTAPTTRFQCLGPGNCQPCNFNNGDCFLGGTHHSTEQACDRACAAPTRKPTTRTELRYECQGGAVCNPCDRGRGECSSQRANYGSKQTCTLLCRYKPSRIQVTHPPVASVRRYECQAEAGSCYSCDESKGQCSGGGTVYKSMQTCSQLCRYRPAPQPATQPPVVAVMRYECNALIGRCNPCDQSSGQCFSGGKTYNSMQSCYQQCRPPQPVTRPPVFRYQCQSSTGRCNSCDQGRGQCNGGGTTYGSMQTCQRICRPPAPVTRPPAVTGNYFCGTTSGQCFACGGSGRRCPSGSIIHNRIDDCRSNCRKDNKPRFYQCTKGQCHPCYNEFGKCTYNPVYRRYKREGECQRKCTVKPAITWQWFCSANACRRCSGRNCRGNTYTTSSQCKASGCGRPTVPSRPSRPSRPTCGPNEIYKSCGGCEQTCGTRYLRTGCPSRCSSGCSCANGYVRYGSSCVLPSRCPAHPVVSTCSDSSSACSRWAHNGECRKNPFYMKVYCQRSCNSCGTTVYTAGGFVPNHVIGCRDYHQLCPFWSSKCECQNNAKWMRVNCRVSCKTCNAHIW